ncbi:unnamed protein product [Caenorhabditis bovis]|uniref:Uncharacterized protein n=1 Tax=Caenorhabditis bovis TaxID=2654633 RepID=A0A8S1EQT5_9PELO|nr:unnamed protein product [Caenorhabditis bovis]
MSAFSSSPAKNKYSLDTSRTTMRSQHESAPIDTVRYIRKSEQQKLENRPAPPPYKPAVIPRVKPSKYRHESTQISNNTVGKSRPASRAYDTFGENALETIYDQFKFLDESDEQPPSSSTPTSTNSHRPILLPPIEKMKNEEPPSRIIYCVLPIIELLAALAVLVTSFFRWKSEYKDENVEATTDGDLSTQALSSMAFQNALSTVVPAFFQIVSAFFGFWPIVAPHRRIPAQILHIVFNAIVIILWFNSINDLFFKISMEHILLPKDEKYVVDLVIACLTYFATVIIPGITVVVAAFTLMPTRMQSIRKSMSAISISLGSLIFACATTVISVFIAQANLNGSKDLTNDNYLTLAYGLKEAIVFIFVVFVTIFSLIVSTQNNRPLMFAASIGQGISLMAISSQLYTPERVQAVVNQIQGVSKPETTTDIGVVLLNACALASVVLLIIQLAIFVTSIIRPNQNIVVDNNMNPSGVRCLQRIAF